MKTAVVVGATSMLGRQLIARLEADGVAVLTAGRAGQAAIGLDLESGWLGGGPDASMRADVLFHCAASFLGDSREGVRKNFLVNALGCHWVLDLAERLQCTQVVNAGSIFSIDGVDSAGVNSYGLSKAQGEQILAWGMHRQGGRSCTLRLPQLYDVAGECVRHQPWFGRIIAYAARGLDLRMPASAGTRNFLHVQDAAAMMLAAAKRGEDCTMDVAHPESMAHEHIAALAYEIFGKSGNVLCAPEKAPFRGIAAPNGQAAFERLDLAPAISMAQGIALIRDAGSWAAFGPLDVT